MSTNFIAFLFILAIILLLLFFPNKKKRLIFSPEWEGDWRVWINNSTKNLQREDLCENCLSCAYCGIREALENIKDEHEINFLITRCKIFQANTSLKMQKLPEQQEHFGVIVWVNPFTESIREKQCMCINDCRNLNIKDREKNCLAANELYDLCVQYNLATIVFSCPIWDTIQGGM